MTQDEQSMPQELVPVSPFKVETSTKSHVDGLDSTLENPKVHRTSTQTTSSNLDASSRQLFHSMAKIMEKQGGTPTQLELVSIVSDLVRIGIRLKYLTYKDILNIIQDHSKQNGLPIDRHAELDDAILKSWNLLQTFITMPHIPDNAAEKKQRERELNAEVGNSESSVNAVHEIKVPAIERKKSSETKSQSPARSAEVVGIGVSSTNFLVSAGGPVLSPMPSTTTPPLHPGSHPPFIQRPPSFERVASLPKTRPPGTPSVAPVPLFSSSPTGSIPLSLSVIAHGVAASISPTVSSAHSPIKSATASPSALEPQLVGPGAMVSFSVFRKKNTGHTKTRNEDAFRPVPESRHRQHRSFSFENDDTNRHGVSISSFNRPPIVLPSFQQVLNSALPASPEAKEGATASPKPLNNADSGSGLLTGVSITHFHLYPPPPVSTPSSVRPSISSSLRPSISSSIRPSPSASSVPSPISKLPTIAEPNDFPQPANYNPTNVAVECSTSQPPSMSPPREDEVPSILPADEPTNQNNRLSRPISSPSPLGNHAPSSHHRSVSEVSTFSLTNPPAPQTFSRDAPNSLSRQTQTPTVQRRNSVSTTSSSLSGHSSGRPGVPSAPPRMRDFHYAVLRASYGSGQREVFYNLLTEQPFLFMEDLALLWPWIQQTPSSRSSESTEDQSSSISDNRNLSENGSQE